LPIKASRDIIELIIFINIILIIIYLKLIMFPILLFSIIVLIFSVIVHEYSHGWAAYKLGDPTAKNMGRLSLNPIKHLDPIGSIALPLLLIITKAPFLIGWAKPVPYNPNNLNDSKYGDLKVALAGPGSNFIMAIIFGLIARFLPISFIVKNSLISGFLSGNYDLLLSQMSGSIIVSIFVMSLLVCFINLVLMLFNLIPIPPLDGSKVLYTFLPTEWRIKYYNLERYGFIIILFLLFFGFIDLIFYPIFFIFRFLVGF